MSADLLYSPRRTPGPVSREHVAVNSLGERHAQPISERQALAARPSMCSPFGVGFFHSLDPQAVARKQRPCQIPVAPGTEHLLGNLGPVRRPTYWLVAKRSLHNVGTILILKKRKNRRGVQDNAHSASSLWADVRRSARSSLTKSSPWSSLRTRARSCSRVSSTRPSGLSSRTRGVPAESPTRLRTSAGKTRRPRSPTTIACVPLM